MDLVYGVPIPNALYEAIETERDTLSKAESLLSCLANSMENETDAVDQPYYPDVVRIARQLLRQSINGLDSLTLERLLSRDRVEDDLAVLPRSSRFH